MTGIIKSYLFIYSSFCINHKQNVYIIKTLNLNVVSPTKTALTPTEMLPLFVISDTNSIYTHAPL